MRNKKDNLVYVQDIRDAIDNIMSYSSSKTIEQFTSSEWDQAAIIRFFEIIGEAASNIDDSFKEKFSEVEWRDMSDFRNYLIHDYADIDVDIVWDAITKNVPLLKEKVENVLRTTQTLINKEIL